MYGKLMAMDEIISLINGGKKLLIAGDESLLEKLPQGDWIAGTIPYFMADEGGVKTKDKAFVNIAPEFVSDAKIVYYTSDNIENVYNDAYENGFSIIIIPASCKTHFKFALDAPHFQNFATTPLIGWISGVDLDELGKKSAKIFNGSEGNSYDDGAIVYHFKLPENWAADLHIINIFKQGDGDALEFPQDGFSAKEVIINGKSMSFVKYLKEHDVDTRFPLVADYEGALINVSFQSVDEQNDTVNFYAPVFKGVRYKLASPEIDYVKEFDAQLCQIDAEEIGFSCNCILNFLYGELEGKKTGSVVGPITFGEIAYQLVNQTLVYLEMIKLD